MNISRIFRLSFVFVLMLFFVIVSQYYMNFKNSLEQTFEDLKVAVFVKDNIETLPEEITDALNNLNYLNVIEYVDSQQAYTKAIELNPELSEIFSQEEIKYPAYVLANKPKAKNVKDLENIKNEIKLLDFVDDVIYDTKAYSLLFENFSLLCKYQKIFLILFILATVIFLAKVLLFSLKKQFKNIVVDLLIGVAISVVAYVVICLFAVISKNSVFVLNWQILYFVLPLGMIMSFITKETNA